SFPVPGGATLRGISIIKECDRWFGLVTSYGSSKVFWLDFDSGLNQTPQSGEITFFTSYNFPASVSLIEDGGEFYAFIQSALGSLYRLSFGESIIDKNGSGVNLGNFGVTENFATEWVKEKSDWYGFSIDLGNRKLIRYTFPTTCDASMSTYEGADPPQINFLTAGTKNISLIAKTGSGNTKSMNKSITISALTAPDISFTSQNICANNDVNFTSENTSGDITGYNWDFDYTNTSMAQDPIHQFTAAGDYEVKLQVTASNGCNNLARETITIYNEPVADFDLPSASPICTNQDYLFTNTTSFDVGSNPSWQWEINGTPTSTVEDLTYEIPTATMQDIKLIATIPGCSSEVIKTINTVEDGPLADFSFVNDCEDKSITFTNTTVGTVTGYSWDFGDGNTSGLTNGTNTFDDFGTYDVTLEATNAAGCINTSVQEITIYSKPQPDFSLDLPPFSCNGSPSQFNDLTPNPADSNLDSWVWSFGDPQSGSSLDRNPQYIYGDAGQYNVNLDVTTNFGCTASVQKMVTISQTPDANFTFNAACINQATSFMPQSTTGIDSWQWKVGVSTYNQQNPTHVFSTPSNYNVQLTANGANGCIGVKSQTINVPVPSTVDFSFENNCTNQDTQFTDLTNVGSDPVSSRLWQFGSLGSASGATPSFSFPSAGAYPTKLTVTNQSGCSYSTTKIVNVTQSPIATFTASPQTGTPPLIVQLNNTSASSLSQLWTANDPSNSSSTEKTASFTFDKLGEYVVDLTIEDESGCTSVSSKIISVIIPTLDIELTQLSLMPSPTGESNILLSLTNKSNFPVNNIKAVIDISGEALISETITATIQPNEVYSQILSVGIIGSKSGANYLCVELVVDGDANTLNNKKCLNNDAATVVMAPYPNPGSDNLNLEWISTAATSAEIHIFDPTGRKVYENMFFDLDPGLNHATISVGLLNPGMYYVFFVSGDVRRSFPFVVRR
ncbi:MAG: PKD domain-containing protein, partial [Cyclobacteriaceae bacterium]